MCGEFRSSVYQYFSRRRSFTRSIYASPTVVHSAGAGVVPKGNLRQKNASSSTIAIQVDVVVEFVCIRR